MNPDVNKPPTCFNVYNPDTILWMANLIDIPPAIIKPTQGSVDK